MENTEFVDVLCVGSGSAGLAVGVAGVDAGLSVFIAEPSRKVTAPVRPTASLVESWTTVIQRRWGAEDSNNLTMTYLDQLTSSLGPPAPVNARSHLPFGQVETFGDVTVDPAQVVSPFYGADLAIWARECLMSPFGMIFTQVSPSPLTPLRRVDGSSIAAGLVASVPTTGHSAMTVRQWLSELALEKGVEVHESSSVRELLFDHGRLVGATVNTPEGVRAVRARRGVLLGTSCSEDDEAVRMLPILDKGTKLCIVGRTASRFARLEFLLSKPSRIMRAARSPQLTFARRRWAQQGTYGAYASAAIDRILNQRHPIRRHLYDT